jgi:multidrug efflux pump subunit AcrB
MNFKWLLVVLLAMGMVSAMGCSKKAASSAGPVKVAQARPVSVLACFIPMYWLGISSNIMSLAGIAISIGVLVDGAIE